MDWITPIQLTEEQEQRLRQMAAALVPSLVSCTYENEYLDLCINKGDSQYKYIAHNVYTHWLEFCFTFLAAKIAARYVKHHVNVMPQWAEHMILQKIAHEIHKYNPIDTLYELYVHPEKYAEDL